MTLSYHLHFNGRCEEAFQFYAQLLGGRIQAIMPYAGSPAEAQTAPEWRNKVLHAAMTIDGQTLMGADPPPQYYQPPQGFSVSVEAANPAEASRIFQALAEGGAVKMPMQKTFWSPAFGMLVDRFGIPWMVNCATAA